MNLKIDPSVFLVKDTRVQALRRGKLTANAFARFINQDDCFVQLGDTIYALSQSQYYSYKVQLKSFATSLSQSLFRKVIDSPPSCLTQHQKALFAQIKLSVPNCTKCQYKRNKNLVALILAKYPQVCQREAFIPNTPQDIAPYPETTQEIKNQVSTIMPVFFNFHKPQRTPCFDCVQKHLGISAIQKDIAKASIKQAQVEYGYSQHFALGIANLQEAFQECPPEAKQLRDTLLFCIGKSKADGKLFVPLAVLLKLLFLEREELEQNIVANAPNTPAQDMQLQFTEQMKHKVEQLDVKTKVTLMLYLKQAQKCLQQDIDNNDQLKAKWQGALSSAADAVVAFSPQFSNMIRNRRLIFKINPSLIKDTQYDTKQIQVFVKSTMSAKVESKMPSRSTTDSSHS